MSLADGTVIGGGYEVLGPLGSGSFGEVYRCLQLSSGREVAVKTEEFDFDPTVDLSEIGIIKDLFISTIMTGNKHFAEAVEYGPDRDLGIVFFVMPLLGTNLDQLRKRQPSKCFTLEQVLNIGIQSLDALENLHTKGHIHRDVKPSNIVVDHGATDPDHIYLIDFGLSMEFRTQVDPNESNVFGFSGTSIYASPFALENKHQGRRDDLYGLLYSLIELVKGNLPWDFNVIHDDDDLMNAKYDILDDDLLEGLPFRKFYTHIKQLEELSEPNYDLIREEFLENLKRLQSPSSSDYGSSLDTPSEESSPTLPHEECVTRGKRFREMVTSEYEEEIVPKAARVSLLNLYPDIVSSDDSFSDFDWICKDDDIWKVSAKHDALASVSDQIEVENLGLDLEPKELPKKKLSKTKRFRKFLRRLCCCGR